MENFGLPNFFITLFLIIGAFATIAFASKKLPERFPAMLPIPVQSFFFYCTFFTAGLALICTDSSLLTPWGFALALLGMSIFLPERWAVGLVGLFLLLLGVSLLSVLQEMRAGTPWSLPPRKISDFGAMALLSIWGAGILFGWRRWSSARRVQNQRPPLPPLVSQESKEPNQPPEPTPQGGVAHL